MKNRAAMIARLDAGVGRVMAKLKSLGLGPRVPRLEDGSNGFQFYENGGATGCWAYCTIHALYASFCPINLYVLREVSTTTHK